MTMNDNELLSALIDGELAAEDLDRAIALLNQDSSAKQRLLRYQQNSDILGGYTISQHSMSLADTVSQALADEPPHRIESQSADNVTALKADSSSGFLPEWFWQQAMGLAIAASIGALAVVGVWQQSEPELMPGPLATIESEATKANVITTVAHGQSQTRQSQTSRSNRWTVGEPEVADRLNTYLVDHNEYAGTSAIFSNARVIAYEAE